MKIKQIELIEDLITRTQEIIVQVETYKILPDEKVNWKSSPEKWSVLECLEHLNLYGDFYLEEIEKQIQESTTTPVTLFISSWFGNYFANSMLPKNGKIRKMKTFRDKDPIHSKLTSTTIDRFLKQQFRMLELLKKAQSVDINKVKTSITVPVIKLKLGDTFRVVIYHNQRHMLQAEKVLKTLENK